MSVKPTSFLVRQIKGKRSGKNANRSRSGTVVIVIIMGLFGLFSVMPIIIAVNMSLKPISEIFIYPPRIFVQNPTGRNFKILFEILSYTWVPFSRYIFNTVFITLIGTLGNVLLCSMAAYPFAKHGAPGFRTMFGIVTLSLMFNVVVGDVANFITISSLGWLDNYLAVIIPAFATPLGLFMMRQFMVQIPDDMINSAKIDGASEYKVFLRIIMPQVKPAWLTLSIFSFQALWALNNTPYIYSEELKTLGYAMNQILTSGVVRTGPGAAASVIMMIPPIVFFILSQSQIMQTMTASGIKE